MNNEELWQAVLGEVELSVSKAQFVTWFKDTAIISKENGKIIIGVPNGFAKEWLENKFNSNILSALNNFEQGIREISCSIYTPQQEKAKSMDVARPVLKENQAIDLSSFQSKNMTLSHFKNTNLNPRYVFENFIIGENNELARAACYAVSQNLGTVYNPLFLYGGVGLGKTHLLQSIGNEITKNNPDMQILYTSSERFTTELVDAIKNQKIDKFKENYQKIDLLIIDDIQFISGKEKTQDIFFHIFNFLYQLNKQIVISSDRPPKDIQILEERLRSRFEGGMIVDVGNPDLETRMAILRAKAAEKDFFLEEEVIRFIAENIKNNIRELEGALNRVIATSELSRKNPDMESVKKVLSNIISSGRKKGVGLKDIVRAVADYYELSENELLAKGRKKKIAVPRQIAMFLMRREFGTSYPAIGDYFGGRDHTTALHAYKKISSGMEKDERLKEDVLTIKNRIFNI